MVIKLHCVYLTLLGLILTACQVSSPPTSPIFTQIPEGLDTPFIPTKTPATTHKAITNTPSLPLGPSSTPAQPTATVIPQSSPTSPAPTSTIVSPNIIRLVPIVAAASIWFDSWSPDSQWIAYWVSSTEDVQNPISYSFVSGTIGL